MPSRRDSAPDEPGESAAIFSVNAEAAARVNPPAVEPKAFY